MSGGGQLWVGVGPLSLLPPLPQSLSPNAAGRRIYASMLQHRPLRFPCPAASSCSLQAQPRPRTTMGHAPPRLWPMLLLVRASLKEQLRRVVPINSTASNICGCVCVCWLLLPTDLQPARAPLHVCRPADQQACQAAEERGLGACVGPVQPRHEGKLVLRSRRCLPPLLLLLLLQPPPLQPPPPVRQHNRQRASAAAAAAATLTPAHHLCLRLSTRWWL